MNRGFLFLFLSACCLIFEGTCFSVETNSLRVSVLPSKKQVHVKEKFNLELRILNPTTTNQLVHTWSCQWPTQWTSNNKRVTWNFDGCDGNFPCTLILSPGASHTNQLEVFIREQIPGKKISWRMGFRPDSKSAAGKMKMFDYDEPIWSDEVAIEVIQ